MKPIYNILILGLLIYGCQSNNNGYEIINRTKTIKKNGCEIPVSYPEIKGLTPKEKLTKLNEVLEDFPEHEYYAKNCKEVSSGGTKVKGDYQVLLQNDTILCIEFRTLINFQEVTQTVYHSIVLNPNEKGTSNFKLLELEPEQIIPNFNRGLIYPYIEKFNADNKTNINLLAYEIGSNYVITWGVSKDFFIVYVGGEGEWFGYDKIEIPLNELK